jgi:hypothetical protein
LGQGVDMLVVAAGTKRGDELRSPGTGLRRKGLLVTSWLG